jgi:hypothetical protein
MGIPRQEIIRFLELSVVYLPIAAVLIWGFRDSNLALPALQQYSLAL